MATPTKHIVFDIIGTCVSYDAFFARLDALVGPRLRAEHHLTARALGLAWMETAEREFAFLDAAGRHAPFFAVFRALFHRVVAQLVGGSSPRPRIFSDADADACAAAYRDLDARDGVRDAWARLRAAGFEVWALTTGDVRRVRGYLARAGLECADARLVSCEGLAVRKPAAGAYRAVRERIRAEGGGEEVWFAAAHMWDASAARQNGFKAAWCSAWEVEPLPEVFGEVDVVADSLVEMADRIIAAAAA